MKKCIGSSVIFVALAASASADECSTYISKIAAFKTDFERQKSALLGDVNRVAKADLCSRAVLLKGQVMGLWPDVLKTINACSQERSDKANSTFDEIRAQERQLSSKLCD